MPTLIELESISDNIKLCRELNLDIIEINMNMPGYQLNSLKDLKPGDINYSLHLPEDINYSLHLPEDLNVWSFNNKIRNAYVGTVLDTIELAKAKNITILNMHMSLGIHFTLPHKKVLLFEQYSEQFIKNTISFGQTVQKELKNTGIHIYIENTGIYNHLFIERAVEELLKFDNFRLT